MLETLNKNSCHTPPKISNNFFHEGFKIEKNMMCRMCANTVSFQNDAWDGHKCSGFQPFLNWIFPRGDTSIFSKKLASFYLQKWGGVWRGLKSTRYVGFVSKRCEFRVRNVRRSLETHIFNNPHRVRKQTINESLNQTLSRTIVTSLTTLLVVMVLFIYGGRFWNKGWDIGSFDLESNIPEKNILKGEIIFN